VREVSPVRNPIGKSPCTCGHEVPILENIEPHFRLLRISGLWLPITLVGRSYISKRELLTKSSRWIPYRCCKVCSKAFLDTIPTCGWCLHLASCSYRAARASKILRRVRRGRRICPVVAGKRRRRASTGQLHIYYGPYIGLYVHSKALGAT